MSPSEYSWMLRSLFIMSLSRPRTGSRKNPRQVFARPIACAPTKTDLTQHNVSHVHKSPSKMILIKLLQIRIFEWVGLIRSRISQDHLVKRAQYIRIFIREHIGQERSNIVPVLCTLLFFYRFAPSSKFCKFNNKRRISRKKC